MRNNMSGGGLVPRPPWIRPWTCVIQMYNYSNNIIKHNKRSDDTYKG